MFFSEIGELHLGLLERRARSREARSRTPPRRPSRSSPTRSGVVTWREMFGVAEGASASSARTSARLQEVHPVVCEDLSARLGQGSSTSPFTTIRSWYATAVTPRVTFVVALQTPRPEVSRGRSTPTSSATSCAERYAYHNNFTPAWFMESLAIYLETKRHRQDHSAAATRTSTVVGVRRRGSPARSLAKSKFHARIKSAVKKRQPEEHEGAHQAPVTQPARVRRRPQGLRPGHQLDDVAEGQDRPRS